MMPSIWTEDLQFDFCKFCRRGRTCNCAAAESEKCFFCTDGCDCGYEQLESGLVCDCECDCEEEEEEGNCSNCCICSYPLRDELPDQCYCECGCEPCSCRCTCGELVIDADSYNRWVRQACYVCPPECLTDEVLSSSLEQKNCLTEVGPYEFFIRTMPVSRIVKRGLDLFSIFPLPDQEVEELSRLVFIQDGLQGSVRFTGPVHIPMLAEYNPISGRDHIWMSLTPMEVMSQKPGVDMARRRVLIGGLGMGWMTQRVLAKRDVSHVTQVELDPAVIDFFGRPLKQRFGNKLDLVESEFYEFVYSVGLDNFDTILIDIWPRYLDALRDRQFLRLRQLHPRVWGWGQEGIKNQKSF